MSPESWNFSQQGALGGGGELSPGVNSTGFSSRALVFGDSNGRLTNNSSAPHWDSTNNRLGIGTTGATAAFSVSRTVGAAETIVHFNLSESAATTSDVLLLTRGSVLNLLRVGRNGEFFVGTDGDAAMGVFGAAGTTQAPAYTTAAITTGRVFPTTASISTFTGVSGAGASFTSRADLEALVRVVAQMYEDLKGYGLLR